MQIKVFNRIKSNKYLKSLKFRIAVILILMGTVPNLFLGKALLQGYEERTLNNHISDVQNQFRILSKQLAFYNYLAEPDGSEMMNGEILQAANFYDGRVIIVDQDFKVIMDTYGLEEGKTMISEQVIKCMKGESTRHQVADRFFELVIPIQASEDSEEESMDMPEMSPVLGAIVVNASTDSISASMEVLSGQASVIQVVIGIIVVAFSIVFSSILVRPFKRMTKSIDAMNDGHLDEIIEINDYTETRLISQSFNKVVQQMRVLDETRQEFVSNVSHELKTPLTSMKVLADSLLMQEQAPVEMYQEFMGDIAEEIDRENKIINDLLSLVKLDKKTAALNIEPTNINDLLELILRRLRPIAAKRNIEVVLESIRPVTAEIDEVKLTLAFTNLVENAIKYNHENGWVRVTLDADHQFFYVKVADSGIGIPKEEQQHIYERFYRVDKSHSSEIDGTGLGLAITKSAILAHKGSIKIKSEPEEGTTFSIRIPLTYIA